MVAKSVLATETIRNVFGGGKSSIHSSCVGVEVEAEYGNGGSIRGDTLEDLTIAGVNVIPDGSLRNGAEFVTKPIKASELKNNPCFVLIGKALKEMKARTDSPRTSTHVHLNMFSSTFLQVVNFAVTYWSLEQVLLRLCDEYRHGNMFALTITDSHAMLDTISEAFETDTRPRYTENEFKYSSFNFTPLHRLGTVEIRIMHGLTSKEPIEDWAILCAAIRELSFEFDTPNDVLAVKPRELFDRFMAKLPNDNVWKDELLKINPDLPLDQSREILDVWSCGKSKDYWMRPSRSKVTPRPTRELVPEQDFQAENQDWVPVNLEEDM